MVSPYVSVREKGAMVPADALSLDEPRYQELMEETGREKIWRQYFDWDGIDKPTASDAPPERIEDDPTNNIRLKNRTVRDEFLRRAAQDLISQDSDFFVVYYRVTDILSHSLWKFYDPDAFEEPPTARELELFGESIRQAYRFTDLALGDLLEAWQGEANIIIVSDHGFGRASRAKMDDPEHRNQFLTGDHRPTGIFLASGPYIQPGEIQGVSTMEIAPTLATMLGLPVAGDLPGRVVTELFRPDYFTERPLKTVDSYADVSIPRQDVTADVGNQEEEMNTLRGLGYVGEGATFDADQVSSDYDFWGANRQVVIAHLAGEIVFYLMQGNIESARSVLELARDNRPGIEKRILTAVRQRHQKLQKRVPPGTIAAEPFEAFLSASVQTKPRSQ
jgi:hypothetical protein